jgi:hypothetical protein
VTPDLEHRLRELSRVIDFPPTPDLAGAVERRLAGPERAAAPTRRRWRWQWRTIALAAALLLLVATAAGATVVRLWLDVPSVVVRRVAAVPAVPAGAGLGLGERVAVAEAADRAGFDVLPPADPRLGEPDAAYIAEVPPRQRLSLVWRPQAGFPPLPPAELGAVLTVLPGGTPTVEAIQKMVAGGTDVEAVDIGDGAAWWVAGAPHVVIFEGPTGELQFEELRLAGNVLLWQRDGFVFRLEAQVDRDTAIELARTVRAVER